MKIALCLSGQPRGLVKAHDYVRRNLLSCNDVDIFCHVWENGEEVDKLYSPLKIKVDSKDTIKLDKIYNDYNQNHHTKNTALNSFSFFYSILQANNLKTEAERETGKIYDVVIRSRYDFAIARKINFFEYDMNFTWTPLIKIQMPSDFLCTDQFAFSNSKNMNFYADVFNNLEKYHDSGTKMLGESMIARQYREHNLIDKIKYIDMWDPFFGGKYNYGPHSLVRDDMEKWIK
jgi:hypothetical protein